MNRWLQAGIIVVGLITAAPAAEPSRKPNVLFLLADDMRADSIAAVGNPVARTPNLDALVNRGFALTNTYCFGGNSAAVCTPSRNMLLSGNAYFRWKDFIPPGMPKGPKGLLAPGNGSNFPVAMREAGYLSRAHRASCSCRDAAPGRARRRRATEIRRHNGQGHGKPEATTRSGMLPLFGQREHGRSTLLIDRYQGCL